MKSLAWKRAILQQNGKAYFSPFASTKGTLFEWLWKMASCSGRFLHTWSLLAAGGGPSVPAKLTSW